MIFMMEQRLVIFISILALFLPLSYASAGTILSSNKYTWSNNVGYINFASTTVSNSALGGYAWSANKGWINMSPAQGGVLNDGTGNLSGSAWGVQLGWIDFNNVSIDTNGKFSGTADGSLVGTITFDCPNYCDVETDWRPVASSVTPPPVAPPSSGGGLIPNSIATPALPVEDPVKSAQAKLIDIQKDGVINILDFNALMVSWGSSQDLAAVGSAFSAGIINFNALMVYWGITYQI